MVDGVIAPDGSPPASAPVLPLGVTNEATFNYVAPGYDLMYWSIAAPADGIVFVELLLDADQTGAISFAQPQYLGALGPQPQQYATFASATNVRPGDVLFVGASAARAAGGPGYTSLEDVWRNYADGIYMTYYPDLEAFRALVIQIYGNEQAFVDAVNAQSAVLEEGPSPLRIRTTFVATDDWTDLASGQRQYAPQVYQTATWSGDLTYDSQIAGGFTGNLNFRDVPVEGIPALTECAWRTARRFDGLNNPARPSSGGVYSWAGACPTLTDAPQSTGFTSGWAHAGVFVEQVNSSGGAYRGLRAAHDMPVNYASPARWAREWSYSVTPPDVDPQADGTLRFTRVRVAGIRVRPDEAVNQPYGGGPVTWHLMAKSREEDPNGWGPRPTLALSGSASWLQNYEGPEGFVADAEVHLTPYAGGAAAFTDLPDEIVERVGGSKWANGISLIAMAFLDQHFTDTPPSYPVYSSQENWAQARQGCRLVFQADFVMEYVDVPIPVDEPPAPSILADQRGRRRIFVSSAR